MIHNLPQFVFPFRKCLVGGGGGGAAPQHHFILQNCVISEWPIELSRNAQI